MQVGAVVDAVGKQVAQPGKQLVDGLLLPAAGALRGPNRREILCKTIGCVALRSLRPAYFSWTSAGAIVGSRSALTRTMRGSFTQSVFQPRWTSLPENGPAPRMFPIRRYSSAAYPMGMVTDDPSFSSRTDRILKCSYRAALHPSCTT